MTLSTSFIVFLMCLFLAHLNNLTSGYGVNEQLWLEVVYPKEIAFVYKIKTARDFGGVLSQPLRRVNLVTTEPEEACNEISNGESLKNQIALIKRGGCSFLTKTLNAQNNDAAAVIIHDSNPDDNKDWVEMVGDETGRNHQVGIPSFFMLGKDGRMITDALKRHTLENAVINIPVNFTFIDTRTIHQPPWDLW